MTKLICLIKGHDWGETALDQAIADDWGLFTCKRCWHKLGQAPHYDERTEMLRLASQTHTPTKSGVLENKND